MTIKKGRKELQTFKDACVKDGDPFFVAHFSRVENKFDGCWDGLDELDAAIIIRQLVRDFNISEVKLVALSAKFISPILH